MKQETTPILSVEDLTIGYRNGRKPTTVIHSGLQLSLYRGELTTLLGANGVGKSTLLRTLAGVQPPLSGLVTLDGKPITSYNATQLSRQIALVLTDKTVSGGLTVHQLVALGRHSYTRFFGTLSSRDNEIVAAALNDVGIAHKAQHYLAELSDGERQKAMIAKAIAQESPLIVLDEPTAFLDVASRLDIFVLLRRLAAQHNKAVLLSTHDVEQAIQLSDKLLLLSDTEGMLSGTTEDKVLDGSVARLFDTSTVAFHPLSGTFRAHIHSPHTLPVHANDELYFWSANALQRCHIEAIPYDEAMHTTYLAVESHTAISYIEEGRSVAQFESYASLVAYCRTRWQ